ncbi:hypothetical protein UFOVP903_21 [uncultured Caudovirales phage]|uniref:Uncharacterized protein n=1 Tax=uncultured Caudovirales phage TaxID=2100421 RepID=A0A6J5RTU9_9CAUD|nr:hypothetical protein UFOVP903_21 [uncultured Caudovirales phage]CAB4197596.1 hypothetical protein UFOVP1318_25 [uncultured Caudovirales phage]CAB4210479.1 hypothetical protein UFOVP1430_19 [uncultured Caudovirales phage]
MNDYNRNGGYPLSGKEKMSVERILARAEDLLEQLDVFTVVVGSAAIKLEDENVRKFHTELEFSCGDIREEIEVLRREEKGKHL